MNSVKRQFVTLTGTFFYVGKIPGPGGTIGSAAIFLPLGLLLYMGISPTWFTIVCAGLLILSFIGSVWTGRHAKEVFGKPDPNCVVLDEVAGAALSLLCFPYAAVYQWQGMLAAFFLFRIFDVLKPLGIRKLEDVPYGYGIVLDDLGAGLAALVLLQLSRFIFA